MDTIKIKGKNEKFKFGNWVIEQLTVKYGFNMQDFGNIIADVSSGVIPKALHLGLCQSKGRNIEAFDLNDVYDFLDDVGIFSKEMQPVISKMMADMSVALTGKTVDVGELETIDVKEKVTKKK